MDTEASRPTDRQKEAMHGHRAKGGREKAIESDRERERDRERGRDTQKGRKWRTEGGRGRGKKEKASGHNILSFFRQERRSRRMAFIGWTLNIA